MLKTVCRYSSVGLTVAGVGALLFVPPNAVGVNTLMTFNEKVRLTADFSRIVPWSLALAPSVATGGAAALAAAFDDTGADLTGALGVGHQIGPAIFALNSVRSLSRNQPPAGSNTGTVNYTNMDQWVLGIPGVASSTGALGFTEDAAAYEPLIATHAGVLQTNNQLGPVFFNLNVLKAIGFTQAPNGQVLMNGRPDNFSAVDIGRWNAGVAGVITNSGTTGFVTADDAGNGLLPSDYRIGGLQTTTTIGSAAYTVNVLPSLSTSLSPLDISFAMAPDMTAVKTPFAPSSPPPPGVIQHNGGLPVPNIVTAAQNAVSSGGPLPLAATGPSPAAAAPTAPTPTAATPTAAAPQTSTPKPKVVIPGVNGAPLAKPTTTNGIRAAAGGVTSGARTATGSIANGIRSATGAVSSGIRSVSGG